MPQRGLEVELTNELQKAIQEITAFANATVSEMKRAGAGFDAYNKSVEASTKTISSELNKQKRIIKSFSSDINKQFAKSNIGSDLARGFTIDDLENELRKGGRLAGIGLTEGFEDNFEPNDFERLGFKAGDNLIEGLADGLKSGNPEQQIDSIVNEIRASLDRLTSEAKGLGLNLEIDTGSVIRDIGRIEGELSGLSNETVTIDSNITDIVGDVATIKVDLGSLPTSQTVDINADIASLKTDVGTAQSLIGGLEDAVINIRANAETSSFARVEDELQNLQALGNIDLILSAGGFLADLDSIPIISDALDLEKQQRRITVSVGLNNQISIDDLDQVTRNIYNSAFGEDRETVQKAVILQAQLDVGGIQNAEDLQTAVQNAFTVQALSETIGQELDTEQVQRAISSLVSTGLVPDIQTATDLLVVALQRGNNQADDLLDTIIEYAPQFQALGISGVEAFSAIDTALATGAFNTDKIADFVKEFNLKIGELELQIAEGEGDLLDTANILGVTQETLALQAGELDFSEYASIVQSRIESALALQAQTGETVLTERQILDFLGTPAEDLTLPVALDLLFSLSDTFAFQPEQIAGATEDVSTVLFGDIGTKLTELTRTFQTELSTAILTGLEASGILDFLLGVANDFTTAIGEGANLGEAIEIAVGLSPNTFANFESILGNFVLEFAIVIDKVITALGKESQGLQGFIQRQTQTQFGFDISIADDTQDIENAITTAISRGLSVEAISSTLGGEITTLISEGEIEKATELNDLFREVSASSSEISEDLLFLVSTLPNAPDIGVNPTLEQLQTLRDQLASGDIFKGAGIVGSQLLEGAFGGTAEELIAEIDLALTPQLTSEAETQFRTLTDELISNALAGGDTELALQLAIRANKQNVIPVLEQDILTTIQSIEQSQGLEKAIEFGVTFADESEAVSTYLAGLQTELDNQFPTGIRIPTDNLLGFDAVNGQNNLTQVVDGVSPTLFFPTLENEAITFGGTVVSGVVLGVENNESALTTSGTFISTAIIDSATNGVTADSLSPITTQFQAVATESGNAFTNVVTQVQSAISQVLALNTDLGITLSTLAEISSVGSGGKGGGGKSFSGEFATGGVASGVFQVGENGRELLFSNSDVAILNNRTSSAFMAGVQTGASNPLMAVPAPNNQIISNTSSNSSSMIIEGITIQTNATNGEQLANDLLNTLDSISRSRAIEFRNNTF